MTQFYTANTNFRSHKPENGLTRYLSQPGFTEDWLRQWTIGRILGRQPRRVANISDIAKIGIKHNKHDRGYIYGIFISSNGIVAEDQWRFYNTLAEAENQRILRDLTQDDTYTYVLRLNMPEIKENAYKRKHEGIVLPSAFAS